MQSHVEVAFGSQSNILNLKLFFKSVAVRIVLLNGAEDTVDFTRCTCPAVLLWFWYMSV